MNRSRQNHNDDDNEEAPAIVRTHLLQLTTDDITNAPRMLKNPEGGGQPLVIVIENGYWCCKLKLDVPSGVTVLAQKWGAHDGELPAGFKCCW
jgi:hypothetical protein